MLEAERLAAHRQKKAEASKRCMEKKSAREAAERAEKEKKIA